MNLIFFQEPDKNHGISFRIVSFKLRSQSPVVTMIHSSLTLSLYCEGLSIRVATVYWNNGSYQIYIFVILKTNQSLRGCRVKTV